MVLRDMLVVTDLADDAESLCRQAAVLARQLGARVLLVHGRHVTSPTDAQARLSALAECFSQPVQTLLVEGSPDHVLTLIDDHHIHMVVVGHPLNGATNPRLTPVLRNVLRHASVPVCVLPSTLPVADVSPWTQLAVATDLSRDSRRGLFAAMQLGRRLRARLMALHVVPRPLLISATPSGPTLPLVNGRLGAIRQFAEDKLADHLAALGAQNLRCHAEVDWQIARGVDRAANHLDADAIVVTTHRRPLQRWLFGSTTESLLRCTARPVVVLSRQCLIRLPQPGRLDTPMLDPRAKDAPTNLDGVSSRRSDATRPGVQIVDGSATKTRPHNAINTVCSSSPRAPHQRRDDGVGGAA